MARPKDEQTNQEHLIYVLKGTRWEAEGPAQAVPASLPLMHVHTSAGTPRGRFLQAGHWVREHTHWPPA